MKLIEIVFCGTQTFLQIEVQRLLPVGRITRLENPDYNLLWELSMLCPDVIIFESSGLWLGMMIEYWCTHPETTFIIVDSKDQTVSLPFAEKIVFM